MPSPEPYQIFTTKLDECGLGYVVTGSLAAIFYGEPRMTNDVDIVLLLSRAEVAKVELAFPLEEFYCPPREVMELEAGREQRGHFNLIHHRSGFKADIYLAGNDPLHAWALANPQVVEIDGSRVCFAPPEYVIARKLQFFKEGRSPKHLRDIERMLLGLGEDWPRDRLLEIIADCDVSVEWKLLSDR